MRILNKQGLFGRQTHMFLWWYVG